MQEEVLSEDLVRLLGHAKQLHERVGDRWTMMDLARASGVSRATLYRLVSSRKQVLSMLSEWEGVSVEVDAFVPLRERVLDAVVVLSSEMLLSEVTLREVALRAGVGEASIYRLFGGRKGLLEAYANERTPKLLASSLSWEPDGDIRETLTMLVGAGLELLLSHGPVLLANLGRMGGGEAEEHALSLEKEARRKVRDWLDTCVSKGMLSGDPNVLTGSLLGMIGGVVLNNIDAVRQAPEAVVRGIVDLFLCGCEVTATTENETDERGV